MCCCASGDCVWPCNNWCSACFLSGDLMNAHKLMIPLLALPLALLLIAGCGSRDKRLTQVLRLQSETNKEMVRLNREVAQGISQLTKENAEFRKEALAVQKQLNTQRAEIIVKQERLDAERRQLLLHDPLIAKAITHVGITLACLLPVGLCWFLLQRPPLVERDPLANDLLLEDLTSKQPVLITPLTIDPPRALPFHSEAGGNSTGV